MENLPVGCGSVFGGSVVGGEPFGGLWFVVRWIGSNEVGESVVSGSNKDLSVVRLSVDWWRTCRWVGDRSLVGRWRTCR